MQTLKKNQLLDLKSSAIQFMFAYAEHNTDKMMSLSDVEGNVWFKPLGEGGKGTIGELGKSLWNSLIDCFPDLSNTVDSAAIDKDGSVRCQVMISGTQAKDFAGIKSLGKHFDSGHIFIFKHNDAGLINKVTISWDHADFVEQLS